ncbi:MAG: CBS domain-containing protein [Candidatus Korarchaeum sp.]|nr:CBS domain-containing protein [Candidatus Korarchaeum sp.]MDW8036077.1 CBS domain-containing protein [Candidatus Korarchaeum sp.]
MFRNVKVSDFMVRDLITIEKDEPVGKALELMERNRISHLLVTSADKLVGVLSVRDIMDGLGSSRFERIPARRIYVSALMSEPPITVEPDVNALEAVKLMLDRSIGALPVLNNGKLTGLVTESDFMRHVDFQGDLSALIKKDHPRIMPNERIVHARSVMLERGARVLPVVDLGKLVGLLTEMILAKAFFEIRDRIDATYMDDVARRIIVEDVMMETPPKLSTNDDLMSARNTFLSTGLPALPITDANEKVIGVVGRRSLLRLLL